MMPIESFFDKDRKNIKLIIVFDIFLALMAVSVTILLISTYMQLPGFDVFGYDEVHYYKDFSFKLVEDGRWVNFLLHDFLRSIPLRVWAISMLVATWMLFFYISRTLNLGAAYSILVTSTIMLSHPFIEQSIWPATIFPAIAILLIVALLNHYNVKYNYVYISSGIFLFGTMQSFYFILPLFYLNQFVNSPIAGKDRRLLLMRHVLWWIAGAVIGVIVMSFIVFMMTGNFGIKPAAWRNIQPILNFYDIFRNVEYVTKSFIENGLQLFRHMRAGSLSFWIVIGLCLLCRFRAGLKDGYLFVLLCLVGLSFFAFSTPLAPIIQSRSLVAMSAAFVLFAALIPGSSLHGRVVGALLLVYAAYGFSIYGTSYLDRYRSETSYFCEKLRAIIPGCPSGYTSLALFGEMAGGGPEARIFNSPPIMHGIINALGAKKYYDCRQGIDSYCDDINTSDFDSTSAHYSVLKFARGRLFFYTVKNNVGVIKYVDD